MYLRKYVLKVRKNKKRKNRLLETVTLSLVTKLLALRKILDENYTLF